MSSMAFNIPKPDPGLVWENYQRQYLQIRESVYAETPEDKAAADELQERREEEEKAAALRRARNAASGTIGGTVEEVRQEQESEPPPVVDKDKLFKQEIKKLQEGPEYQFLRERHERFQNPNPYSGFQMATRQMSAEDRSAYSQRRMAQANRQKIERAGTSLEQWASNRYGNVDGFQVDPVKRLERRSLPADRWATSRYISGSLTAGRQR